ncbi:MAG: T9SS type A sorting domain-containing protein [Salinivirgaceae bacterium]|jgi:uncharacterized repeat protein (TIGR02059 family)|nr:T9SS type A sorting domain-containing protein [Salinivirgaceae bacterium]
MKKNYFLLAAMFLAFASITSAQSVEVTNGGFELGLEDESWGMEMTGDATGEYVEETDDVQEGLKAVRVYADEVGPDDWSTQIFNRVWDVEEGKSYRLGMWFKDVSEGEDTSIVSFTAGHGPDSYTEYARIGSKTLSKEWQELVIYFTSPFTSDSESTDNQISTSTHFLAAGTICLFDNFTVTETQTIGAVLSADGSQVIVEFIETIADPAGNEGSFAVTVGGTANAVTAVALGETELNKVFLTVTDPISADAAVVVTYTPGTLVSTAGTEISEFTLNIGDGETKIIGKEAAQRVSLYPNPTKDVVSFDVKNVESVEVYNITGKLIQSVNANVSSIDVSELVGGVYFIKIEDAQGKVFTNRVIKE